MKATGIVRRIDDLGRVCLPIELRRSLGVSAGDSLEIFMDGENVILKKYRKLEEAITVIEQLANVLEYTDNPHAKELIADAIDYIKKA